MTKSAVWYFDVISPFSYLALGEVEVLSQTTAIKMKPVLFAGLLKHWGQLGPAEIPAKRVHVYRQCIWEAEQRKLPFRLPPAHPFNPINALRLLCALDASPASVRHVMDKIWREGEALEGDSWDALCREMGIDSFARLIEETNAKDQLRVNTDEAISKGVFGVPTLVIDDELFWGADAMPMARAYLSDPAFLRAGEMARAETLGASAQRAGVADRSKTV